MNKPRVVYRHHYFIILMCETKRRDLQSHHYGKYYYTIINTHKRVHCHVNGDEFKAAISICNYAYKKSVPDKYPRWMQERIKRVM